MAKRLVKYKLEGDGTVPKWIEDGGFFIDSYELVGLTVDDERFYVPYGLKEIEDIELENRVKKLHKISEDAKARQVVDGFKKGLKF